MKKIKFLIELIVFILLIIVVCVLVRDNLKQLNKGNAKEKLNMAIKIFSSTENMELEEAIRQIEGMESIDVNRETGEYKIKIDGQDFTVVSKEVLNGEIE